MMKYKENLVSIVVPIYNTSKYLEECINSLKNQIYSDIEILLIDDGSTDESKDICIKHSKMDDRINYIFKENSGVSDTRNMGIRMAKGKYLVFVDSDDYVTPNYISDFMNGVTDEIDCVYCAVIGENRKTFDTILEFEEKYSLLFEKYGGYLWNKMYKTEILNNKEIYMDSNIGMCEDLLFNFQYFQYVKKIKCINKENYYYRISNQTSSNRLDNIKWFSVIDAYTKIISMKCLYDEKIYAKVIYNYYNFLIEGRIRTKYISKSLRGTYKEKIKRELKKNLIEIKYISFREFIKLLIFFLFPQMTYKYKRRNVK